MYRSRLSELIGVQQEKIASAHYAQRADPAFIPISLTGGIGDSILAIGLLEVLRAQGYKMLVASQHATALRYFCKGLLICDGPLPDFTWRLEIDSVSRFKFEKGFSGFLISDHKSLYLKHKQWMSCHPELEMLIDNHPKNKFILANKIKELGLNVIDLPYECLGFPSSEYGYGDPIRRRSSKQYITIHDGFDSNYKVSGRATKTWKWERWNSLVRALHKHYPDLEVIQLGSHNSRIIDGIDSNLVNKTTLREAFDILSESKLHIDCDSGLVHAATTMGVPCVVLFGPTPASFYGHPQNKNISNDTSCSGGCFHLTRNWMDKCPVGYQEPRCMDDISEDAVLEAVKSFLP